MATFQCTHCGMPFDRRRNEELCPACDASGEVVFRRIKEYLYEHPGSSATDLVNNLGVTLKQIRHYLREERLEVIGDGYTGLKCDACGRSIQTGRLCEACAKENEYRVKSETGKAAFNARGSDGDARRRDDPPHGQDADKRRGVRLHDKSGGSSGR